MIQPLTFVNTMCVTCVLASSVVCAR